MEVKKQIVIPIDAGEIVDKITPTEFSALLNGLAKRMAKEGSIRYDFSREAVSGLSPLAERFLQMLSLAFIGAKLGGEDKAE